MIPGDILRFIRDIHNAPSVPDDTLTLDIQQWGIGYISSRQLARRAVIGRVPGQPSAHNSVIISRIQRALDSIPLAPAVAQVNTDP